MCTCNTGQSQCQLHYHHIELTTYMDEVGTVGPTAKLC